MRKGGQGTPCLQFSEVLDGMDENFESFGKKGKSCQFSVLDNLAVLVVLASLDVLAVPVVLDGMVGNNAAFGKNGKKGKSFSFQFSVVSFQF